VIGDHHRYLPAVQRDVMQLVAQAGGGKSMVISATDSRVKVVVVATDEEYMIAKDTYEILTK